MKTLTSQLQSRIDKRSNEIRLVDYRKHCHLALSAGYTGSWSAELKEFNFLLQQLRELQYLDKRLLGRLIELEGHLSHAYVLLGDATEEIIQMQKATVKLLDGERVWQD